jgi:hypothetical protein
MQVRVLLWLVLAGTVGCAGTGESAGPRNDCGDPLAPDLATDRPWPQAVRTWALARPADSLVYPTVHYRSALTAEDRALVQARKGRVVYEFQGQSALALEFRAAALAAFAGGDEAALQARIARVEFGESLCAL